MPTGGGARAIAGGVLLAALTAACAPGAAPGAKRSAAASDSGRVGVDPVPAVHLFENHSSSLVAWRTADVRDRVLVHVDGHADLDWLPDETIARLAASRSDELAQFELHPYTLDDSTHRRFAIWNFVYPAARLGIVREAYWVVPDGTLSDPKSASALVRETVVGKIQMISLDEARGIRVDGRTVHAVVLGIPLTICELADLPEIDEPVLLDIDLDFMTTRSAVSQRVVDAPWIEPAALVEALRRKSLRSDLATLSQSTVGGFLPPACRWVGRALEDLLRRPGSPPGGGPADERRQAVSQARSGRLVEAEARFRRLAEAHPDDATLWYALSCILATAGKGDAAARARSRAVDADPVLAHAELYEADAAWLNEDYSLALERYRAYLAREPASPYLPYALRREAICLTRLGANAEALSLYERVVALAPRHGDTRLEYGILLRAEGRVEEALRELRQARAILPDLSTYAMALGTTLLRAGSVDEAVPHLEAAVQRQPCWAAARTSLATALVRAGRPRDAAPHVAAGLEFDPASPRLRELERSLVARGVAVAGEPE